MFRGPRMVPKKESKMASESSNIISSHSQSNAIPTSIKETGSIFILSGLRVKVHFSSRCVLCARKGPYALRPVFQNFPQRRLRNSSNVRLIDDGPLSSFQARSSNGSSFIASLIQAIDDVVSLVLCPQVLSQAPQPQHA